MSSDPLFLPLEVGNVQLKHRMVMAPLTRFRADEEHIPSPLAKVYYGQRACIPGTLLITEGTFISARAGGYKGAPGIWTDEQVKAWKEVTDTVHAKRSFIYIQLQGLGRIADPEILQEEGEYKVEGASAIPLGTSCPPTPLTEAEIKIYLKDYRHAASNAIRAGFDGIELHGCYGYLVDQFLQDITNQRSDRYGGSIENRSRFAIEAVKALIEVVGDSRRIGIRFSPFSTFQGMGMTNPIPQFVHIVHELKKLRLGHLHLAESLGSRSHDDATEGNGPLIEAWGTTGTIILAGDFTPDKASKVLKEVYPGRDVAIAFGRYFLSTPDLVYRARHGLDMNEWDRSTFYKGGATGYADYPFSEEFLAQSTV